MNEFHYAFQINRMVVFEVSYYTLGSNEKPYFSTQAARFIRSKRDYDTAGQCQRRVLSGAAMTFFRKWDHMHLHDLTNEQWHEVMADIKRLLIPAYNYICDERETFAGTNSGFRFLQLKALSMRTPKK